jgi:thiol-disulfide isomerase/thioredoxin
MRARLRSRILALAIAAAAAACKAGPTIPPDAPTLVLSVQKLDCGSCGDEAAAALAGQPGVFSATFARPVAEITIRYDPGRVSPAQLRERLSALGHGSVEGAGRGGYLPSVSFPAGLDVSVIAPAGEAVALVPYLVPGKVTVFDFFARWCGPCREVDHHLKEVLTRQSDVAVRKIDVVDWDSPAARKHLRDVPDLPYLVVYGRDGRRVDAISGLDLARLDRALAEGGAR